MKVKMFLVSNSPLARKELWFNGLAIIVAIAIHFGYAGTLPKELEVLVPAGIAIVNFIAKWLADREAITAKKKAI